MNKNLTINLTNISLIIYTFSIIVFDEGSLILKLSRIFLVLAFIFKLKDDNKIKIDTFISWFLIFTFFCILSYFWSISHIHTSSMIMTLIYNFICVFIIINLISKDQIKLSLLINTIIFSSIFLEIRIIINSGIFAFLDSDVRNAGTINANTIGIIAAIACLLSIYNILIKKNKKFKFLFIINLIILILSSSRKAIILLILPLALYYIFNSKNTYQTITKIIFSCFIVFIIYILLLNVPFLYNFVGNRIETMINGIFNIGKTDASTQFRITLIEWGIDWFKSKPLVGYGIDCYRYLLGSTYDTWTGTVGTYAHNNFIELLVDVGLIGTLIYYFMHIYLIFKNIFKIKQLNKKQLLMFGILISILIIDYGMVSYYNKFLQIVLIIIWTILNDCYKDTKIESSWE